MLPYVGSIEGQEPGPSLPALWEAPAVLNDDGSPSRATYRRDSPLRVADVSLWGQVSWSYDPATYGQGRKRPPVTVEGMMAAADGTEERAVVTVATGAVVKTASDGR